MKAGIVICTRLGSSRVPKKAIYPLNGVPLIQHLVRRILPAKLPIVLAVPPGEASTFHVALGSLSDSVHLLEAFENDPLLRMNQAANWLELDVVVRITHDKIFVSPHEILRFLDIYRQSEIDYLYSSDFIPGTGFEVISASKLSEAASRFKNVEHISYAIRAITDLTSDIPVSPLSSHRLLLDYQEDATVLETVLRALGNDCSLVDVIRYLDSSPIVSGINRMPLVTFYTCAYNVNKEWLRKAMRSVVSQVGFQNCEYLLVDDGSTDFDTSETMYDFSRRYKNVVFHCLVENGGLASASNFALSKARGEFIIRLDADDWFLDETILVEMITSMGGKHYDAVYPDFYIGTGDDKKIGKGFENNHVGGAIFSTRALNHLRFTDGLRGYEGLDLFERAKSQLRIGYLSRPTFYYRQSSGSLSKAGPVEREAIKKSIEERLSSEPKS